MTFFWCKLGFGKCFGISSPSNYWAGHHWSSYKIHFLLHFTIQSRNGSMLLCQIREENTTLKNNHLKKFWLVHESHTYQASSPFQFASNAVKRSMLSSLPASHVVLRGSALMIHLIGSLSLPMVSHCATHLEGSHSLCKSSWTTTALYVC